MIANPVTLGEKLRNYRIQLKLLQKDVAGLLGVSEDTITFWENNRVKPKKGNYKKIMEFLSI